MKSRRLDELNGLYPQGRWKLGPDGELSYRGAGSEEARLKARIAGADPEGLLVTVTQEQSGQRVSGRSARLAGSWQTLADSRLGLAVERRGAKKPDVLVFEGQWETSRQNRLSYRLERTRLKTRAQRVQTLGFDGRWSLDAKNSLVYTLEGGSGGPFRLRGAFQTDSVLAKKGEIRYQLGAEAKSRRRSAPALTLFGKWKMTDRLALDFELRGVGEHETLAFGAVYRFDPSRTLSASLTGAGGRELGLEVVFEKQFLKKDASAFVALSKSLEESAVEAGFRLRF